MKLADWLEATNPKKAKTERDRQARIAERDRVLKAANTSINTLRVTKCRGSLGDDLLYRLAEATKNEKNKIRVRDERPEP